MRVFVSHVALPDVCSRENDLATVRTFRNQLSDMLGVPRPQLVAKVTVRDSMP